MNNTLATIASELNLVVAESNSGDIALLNGGLEQFVIIDNEDETYSVYATYFDENGDNTPDNTEVELASDVTIEEVATIVKAEFATGMKPKTEDED